MNLVLIMRDRDKNVHCGRMVGWNEKKRYNTGLGKCI